MSPTLCAPCGVNHVPLADLLEKAKRVRAVIQNEVLFHPPMPKADYDAWDDYISALELS